MRRVESDVVNQGVDRPSGSGVVIDRNLLAARLIKELRLGLELFGAWEGLAPIYRAGKNWITLFIARVKLIIGDKGNLRHFAWH